MTGIYFSGTGNTRFCTETLLAFLDQTAQSFPMESPQAAQALAQADVILLSYPVQFSNLPVFVREFICDNAALWSGKRVLCLATMGLFSGDGSGCSARLLKKYGADVIGGLHIHMPDSVCDIKLLKKSPEENKEIIRQAREKLERTAAGIQSGKYPQEGLSIANHVGGLFGQRLWFYGKTQHYHSGPKISGACVGCGQCVSNCPLHNISMQDGKPIAADRCTMCYRCVSICPQKAITLLGKNVQDQRRLEQYLSVFPCGHYIDSK